MSEQAAEALKEREDFLKTYDPEGAWAEEYEARREYADYIYMIQVESRYW